MTTERDKLDSELSALARTARGVIIGTVWLRFCLLMPLIIGYVALMIYIFGWTIR